jgi:hypothetical protein
MSTFYMSIILNEVIQILFIYFFFGGTGALTQGFMLGR